MAGLRRGGPHPGPGPQGTGGFGEPRLTGTLCSVRATRTRAPVGPSAPGPKCRGPPVRAELGTSGVGVHSSGGMRGWGCLWGAQGPPGASPPPFPPARPTGRPARRPVLIDMNKVYAQANLENLDQAFSVAERELGVTRLLDPEGACRCPCRCPLPSRCPPGRSDPSPPQTWTSPSPTRSPSSPTSRPCTTPCPECPTCRTG